MSREVPYSEDEICDVCGKPGVYDFMGDLICPVCVDKLEPPVDDYEDEIDFDEDDLELRSTLDDE